MAGSSHGRIHRVFSNGQGRFIEISCRFAQGLKAHEDHLVGFTWEQAKAEHVGKNVSFSCVQDVAMFGFEGTGYIQMAQNVELE